MRKVCGSLNSAMPDQLGCPLLGRRTLRLALLGGNYFSAPAQWIERSENPRLRNAAAEWPIQANQAAVAHPVENAPTQIGLEHALKLAPADAAAFGQTFAACEIRQPLPVHARPGICSATNLPST
jgi:hypothetical protein